jgi:phospholipid/cholesterol/gamma-HCH transport system ATP-binding protein
MSDEGIEQEVAAEAIPEVAEEFDGEFPIVIRGLKNSFGSQVVHEGLDLEVRRGEVLGVVGGSGSGKSVLMRSIIGLQTPDEGSIEVFGHEVIGANPEEGVGLRSRWGVLFQGGALFSTLTVGENVEVPLKQFYPELLPELMHEIARYKVVLSGLPADTASKYPSELSGGMKKRAGLDPIGAAAFDRLTKELQETLGLTVFLITHDLDTLYAICDRVAVLADGKVIAVGTIPELLKSDHPWIQEYFNGPRGRAAQSGAGLGKSVDSRGQTGA